MILIRIQCINILKVKISANKKNNNKCLKIKFYKLKFKIKFNNKNYYKQNQNKKQ